LAAKPGKITVMEMGLIFFGFADLLLEQVS
jgi:hypothetical protein